MREKYAALVARLRNYSTEDSERYLIDHPICDEAADAIEALLRDSDERRMTPAEVSQMLACEAANRLARLTGSPLRVPNEPT